MNRILLSWSLLWLGLTTSLWAQTTIFSDDFESGTLNAANWSANPGPNNGLATAFNSTSSCSGTYHLRLGKTQDAGSLNLASADLTLNLATYVDSQLTLSFCSYRYYDETQAADGVFASNNGGTSFTKIISFNPSDWGNIAWGTRMPYDLDQLLSAAFGAVPNQVVLRFQQSGTGNWSTSGDEDGIGIDDVIIATERPVSYAAVPYFEDFSSGAFSSEWRISSREANDSLSLAPGVDYLTRYPRVDIAGNDNSLYFGKTSDSEGDNLNAIDLHLKLGTFVDSQLTLSFLVADWQEEDQPNLEGIFVSDDHGQSFSKLLDFTPDVWTDFTFGERMPFDLDQLLKDVTGNNNLPDSIILRFQQFDNTDFAANSRDGIILDNIRISVEPPVSYAPIPYFEDFASGAFTSEWRISSREANDSLGTNYLTRFPRLEIEGNDNSLYLGKSSDIEGDNLNAIDLHLILGTFADSQLTLSFLVADWQEEDQPNLEGIFVSDDHGQSFSKLLDFTPDVWTDFTFAERVPYDLDQLLKSALGSNTLPDSIILRFQQFDNTDFAANSRDGIILDNIRISVEPPVSFAPIPYFEDFASGAFTSEWRISSREANDSLGTNYLTRFPRLEIEGNDNSLYLGKSSDIEGDNLNAVDLHLTLGVFADSQLTLSFLVADWQEEDQPNLEGIFVSDDHGQSFSKLLDFTPDFWTDFTFAERVPFDLDQLLKDAIGSNNLPDSIILRFQQFDNTDFAANSRDGIILDNIRIAVEPSVTYLPIPYFQDFETAVFEREFRVSSEQAVGQTTLSPATTQLTRFYLNEVYNTTSAVSGTYVARMGKSSDSEGDNVNAFDLHLNLEGESQVQLSYWITSFFDELQIDDGLWLSVDAGQSFTKVFNFGLDTMANNVWRLQSIDLSALAAANNLVFSDSTVIRFQQFGGGDFSTSGIEDGLIFDDISVSCSAQTADFTFDVDCSTLEVDFTDASAGTNSTTPYAWDFDGDGVIDTVSNGDITFTYSGTGTFDVTLFVGNADGCGDSITKQVFIGSSVPAPAVTPGGPTVDLCQGDTLILSAAIGYQGYSWNTGATTQTLEVTTPGTYSVRGLGIDGCFSTPTTIEVIERPSPLAPFISLVGEPEFCQGDSVQLVAPFGASSYLWNTGATTQTLTVSTSGTYGVQLANQFGCLSPSADTTITVNPTPAQPTISQSGNILTSSSTGATYRWFLDGVELAVDAQAIDASQFGEGTYTVQVANGECESELSDPLAVTLTSIADAWMGTLTVAPNPAPGAFTLSSPQAAIESVALYDLTGRALSAEVSLDRHEAQVRSDYRGLLIVRVQTERGSWVGKVRME